MKKVQALTDDEQSWKVARTQLKLVPNRFRKQPHWMPVRKRPEPLFTDVENSLALSVEAVKLFNEGKSIDEVRDYIADNKQSIIDDFNNLNK